MTLIEELIDYLNANPATSRDIKRIVKKHQPTAEQVEKAWNNIPDGFFKNMEGYPFKEWFEAMANELNQFPDSGKKEGG